MRVCMCQTCHMAATNVSPPEALCQCRRLARKVHCPSCGLYNVRVCKQRPTDVEQTPNGPMTHRSYTCRVCGFDFNAMTWGPDYCFAPALRASKAAKEEDKTVERAQRAALGTISRVLKEQPTDHNTKLQAAMAKARAAGRDVIPEDFD